MSIDDSSQVLTSAAARKSLGATVERFRNDREAAPVVFGAHRKPEAVIMSFAQYERLTSALEDIEIAGIVRERVGRDGETPLNALLDEHGMGHLKA